MIILHGGWQDGWMLLWAEQSPDELRPEGNGHPAPNEHPYCADHAELVNVLANAVPGFRADSGEAVSATAWLPSRAAALFHPALWWPTRPDPGPSLGSRPGPYRYTECLRRTPSPYSGLQRRDVDHRVSIGGDLAYWSQAVRFGAALVARQQFLPGTIHDAAGARATWVPLFIGADAERLARLSQRMPASARALSGSGAGQPPDQPAATVLRTFVAAVTDRLIRSVNGAPEVTAPKGRREKLAFDSVHDAWLSGLKSIDGAVHGAREQLGQLRAQVGEWQRPIALTASAPFRVCFRLEEPPEPPGDEPDVVPTERDGWYLRYLLQSHEDRSLLLPASAVWKTGGQRVRELERDGFNPREFLLASLGQASGICSGVADSLHRKRPAGRKLDAAMAYQFLTRESMALEEAGYGIILPAWWTRRGTKTKPTIRANVKTPQMQGGGGVSLATMLELNLEVALGDQVMTAQELEALAQLKNAVGETEGAVGGAQCQRDPGGAGLLEPEGRDHAEGRHPAGGGRRGDAGRVRRGRRGSQRLGGGPAGAAHRTGRVPRAGNSRRVLRDAASLPAAGLFLAGVPAALGAGRLLGRRHGPGQDGPDPWPPSSRTAGRAWRDRRCWSARPRCSTTGARRPPGSRPTCC